MRFLTQVLTHAGGRPVNQDHAEFAVADGRGCWALADGLGGHGSGDKASQLACRAALAAFQQQQACSVEALGKYLEAAHGAVAAQQEQDPGLSGMRTTLALLVCEGDEVLWGHVGDTRVYYFEQGVLRARTLDHSVPQAMVEAGELEARALRHHEDRNRLLRSLGGKEELRPTVLGAQQKVQAGDAFLLASDGFWEYVTETAMEVDLAKSQTPGEWLRYMEVRMRESAPEDQDNYTAIAVFAAG